MAPPMPVGDLEMESRFPNSVLFKKYGPPPGSHPQQYLITVCSTKNGMVVK